MIVNYGKLKAHAAIIEGMAKAMQEYCDAEKVGSMEKYETSRIVQDLVGKILIESHWLLNEGFSPS